MAEILSRGDIINEVAAEVDMPQAKIDAIIKAFEGSIARHMKDGDETRIAGFGTFKTTQRSARTSRNPRTGEPVDVPARTAPSFKAGKALKEAAMASSQTAAPAKKAPAKSDAKAGAKASAKADAKAVKAPAKEKAPTKAELSAAAKTLDKAPGKNKKK